MKHHHDYKEKSYAKHVNNSSIEKHRKEKRGEDHDKKFG
jgi:hypothetical protein